MSGDPTAALPRRHGKTITREVKDQRNASERRRTERKRRTLVRMREFVEQLEASKRQLEARFAQQQEQEENEDYSIESEAQEEDDINALSPRSRTRREYLQIVRQIEQLHVENRALAKEISRRELVRNAVERIVDQAQEAEVDTIDTGDDKGMLSTFPLSSQRVHSLATQLVNQVGAFLERARQLPPFTDLTMFGWSDLRFRGEGRIDFAVKKPFIGETAASLADKTWRAFTNVADLTRVLPSVMPKDTVFYFFGDNVAVGWVGKFAEVDVEGPKHPSHDSFLVVRARNRADGREVVLVADFSVDAVLESAEEFAHPMCWFFEDLPPDELTGVPWAMAECGGTMLSGNDAMSRFMIAELMFCVVRWETVGVGPVLLMSENNVAMPWLPWSIP